MDSKLDTIAIDAETVSVTDVIDQKSLDAYADELSSGKTTKDIQASDLIDAVATKDGTFDPEDFTGHIEVIDKIMTEVAAPKMDPEVVTFIKSEAPGLIAAAEVAQVRADAESDPVLKAELQAHADAHEQLRLAAMAGLVAVAKSEGG